MVHDLSFHYKMKKVHSAICCEVNLYDESMIQCNGCRVLNIRFYAVMRLIAHVEKKTITMQFHTITATKHCRQQYEK